MTLNPSFIKLPMNINIKVQETGTKTIPMEKLRAQRGPMTKIPAYKLFNHGGLSITGLLPR